MYLFHFITARRGLSELQQAICDLLDEQGIKWEFENRNLMMTFGRQKKELDLVESDRNLKCIGNRVRIVNGRVVVFKADHQSVIDDLLR
ncbi:unnamed protein product [Lactuca virosa]|uniref:Uncharacterized protein n=1 Tax=Lactuca virosa TaxID=75947 RepID=A0AAU9NWB0_9ASTR|nr:unnamed protein product [Lactuca virosa]